MEAILNFFSYFFENVLSLFKAFKVSDAIDILVISIVIFGALRFIRETRAEQLLKGVVVLLIAFFLSIFFSLSMLSSLIKSLFDYSVILLIVIFQPEIRKALEELGKQRISVKSLGISKTSVSVEALDRAIMNVVDASVIFSRSNTGALIVFEQAIKIPDIINTGTLLDAAATVPLLGNIFFNKAPLHDGAVIIRDARIYSAGCILPLSNQYEGPKSYGTRHRAAIGMSEETDAVVVVVSEETGNISISYKGVLKVYSDRDAMLKRLRFLLLPQNEKNEFFSNFFSKKKSKKSAERAVRNESK